MSVDLIYVMSASDHYLHIHIRFNQLVKPLSKKHALAQEKENKKSPVGSPYSLGLPIAGNGLFFRVLGAEELE